MSGHPPLGGRLITIRQPGTGSLPQQAAESNAHSMSLPRQGPALGRARACSGT